MSALLNGSWQRYKISVDLIRTSIKKLKKQHRGRQAFVILAGIVFSLAIAQISESEFEANWVVD